MECNRKAAATEYDEVHTGIITVVCFPIKTLNIHHTAC